jgi:hypothetical protein
MAFHKTKDGVADSRINRLGRIKREDQPTNRELKNRYFLEIIRKFRPGQALIAKRMMQILGDDQANHQSWIKASAFLQSTYVSLIKELYGQDEEPDEESAEPIQETNRPAFSLVMLPVKAKEEQE